MKLKEILSEYNIKWCLNILSNLLSAQKLNVKFGTRRSEEKFC
jgi:hypothetical protein